MLDSQLAMLTNRDTITQRNKRAREYSAKCRERNKAKFEMLCNRVANGLIIIISIAITCLVAR